MKEVKAIVRPAMLDKVVDALKELPHLPGFTLSIVSVFARRLAAGSELDPGDPDHLEMGKIEIVVPDGLLEVVLDIIWKAARTGQPGDGKIFVYDVAEVVKIRTGERGETSL